MEALTALIEKLDAKIQARDRADARKREPGCGRSIVDSWWHYCGETDMGQSAPALCTSCGGTFTPIDYDA